ncbi:MAG: chorismate-binding protein [Flavobacteriaceae bacterium]|nr:chorismate-binding protein [Flavobacteriaceae bacterium]
MKIIQKKIQEHYKRKLPFVVYNKPNAKDVFGVFQQNDDLNIITNQYDKQGFIFAPFNASDTTVLLPLSVSEFIRDNVPVDQDIALPRVLSTNTVSKSAHIELVEKGVEAIKKTHFKKVVLSRKEKVKRTEIDIVETYNKLLQTYPNAFVYVWFHPKVGLWLGATPETLLKLEGNCFATMALAGTQVYKKNSTPTWNQKEIEEQKFVTDYIVNKLSNFSKGLEVSETETVKAGSLLHLRTEITGQLDVVKENGLFSLIALLHPTPAVCGLPKEAARQFILENENYNRSYYTGFLGELNMGEVHQNDSHLFVNLRCMEINNTEVSIYVGGGITKESNSEKEWEETVAKSTIMLKVL